MTDPVDYVIESLGIHLSKVLLSKNQLTAEGGESTASSSADDPATTADKDTAGSESAVNELTKPFHEQKSFSAMAQHLEALLDRLLDVQDRINNAEVSLAEERVAERMLALHMDRGEYLATQFAQREFGAVKAERARLRRLEIPARSNTSGAGIRDIITRAKLNNHKAASHLYGAIFNSAQAQFTAQLSRRQLHIYFLPDIVEELETIRIWFESAISQLVRSRRVRTLSRSPFNPALKQAPKHLPRLETYFFRAASWYAPGGVTFDEKRMMVLPSKYKYDPGVNLSFIALKTSLHACLQAAEIRVQEDFVLLNVQSALTERFFLSSAALRMCTDSQPNIDRPSKLNDPPFGSEPPAWTYPTAVLTMHTRVHSRKRMYAEGLRQLLAKRLTHDGTPVVQSVALTRTQGLRVELTDRAHLARVSDLCQVLGNADTVVCTHSGTFCCDECRQKLVDDYRSRRPLNRRSKRRIEPTTETDDKGRSLANVEKRKGEHLVDSIYFIPSYRQIRYIPSPREKGVPPYRF